MALWSLVALLLIEGVSGVLAPPPQQGAAVDRSEASDPATSAFAVSFARVYLSPLHKSFLRSWHREWMCRPSPAPE